ncbi:MAG: DUF4838 domain-containing protein [Lentisphaeria bacterium]|nr:DUF4838 domain-containing protein [Lentisphaeria bacterium]
MKNIFSLPLLAALALFPCLAAGAELLLAEDGQTAYTIVTPDAPTQLERLAAEDLRYFLKQVTGADFKVVKNAQAPAACRIFIGMAGQAQKLAGQHKLTEQNPVVQCVGKDIYLFGKGKRGSLFAAYEFIENRLGCRFLDAHGFTYAPRRKKLTVPAETHIARYAFPVRSLMTYVYPDQEKASLFFLRNRQNFDLPGQYNKNGNVYKLLLPPHSMPMLLPPFKYEKRIVKHLHPPVWLRDKAYFESNPEYFSMDEKGKRVPDRHLCFSNPDLQKELTKNILRLYNEVKDKPANAGRTLLLNISSYDKAYNLCLCPKCAALQKQYKSPGAPLLLYLIDLAKKNPGIQFFTDAYQRSLTQIPPELNEKLPGNLVVNIAPINANFSHSWAATQLNRLTRDDILNWCKLTKRILVWYYPNPYIRDGRLIADPSVAMERIARDIRFLRDCGVEGTYFEHDSGGLSEHTNFTALQSYVMLKLFQDPDRDHNKLAAEFISLYYGNAADDVQKYYSALDTAHRKFTASGKTWNHSYSHHYLTLEQLKEWNALLEKAEKKVDGDHAFHLRLLRIGLEAAIIENLRIDFDRKLFDECKNRMRAAVKELEAKRQVRKVRRKSFSERLEQWISDIENSRKAKPVPAELQKFDGGNLVVIEPDLKKYDSRLLRADSHANYGMGLSTHLSDLGDFTASIVKHGGSGEAVLKIPAAKIARDDYALYKFPPVKLTPDSAVKIMETFSIPIGRVANYDDLKSLKVQWDVYLSLRYDGRFRNIYCDRVFLVKTAE